VPQVTAHRSRPQVVADNGWFAARPRHGETSIKFMLRASKDQVHLDAIVNEAQEIVTMH